MLLKVAFLYIFMNEIKQTLVWNREVKKKEYGMLIDSCTTTWNKFIQNKI